MKNTRLYWGMVGMAAVITAITVLSGCAPERKDPNGGRDLNHAYELMDQSRNAEAAGFLEDFLEREGENREARFLLATAQVGLAGADIYRVHDSFKDILFDRSLNDRFFQNPPAPEFPAENGGTPGVNEAALTFDEMLGRLRELARFLGHFPTIEGKRWPLLDQALENLALLPPEKDVALYRVFVRVIYLKSYLEQRVFPGVDWNSRSWVCALDYERAREHVNWLAHQAEEMASDARRIFPSESALLRAIEDQTERLRTALQRFEEAEGGQIAFGTWLASQVLLRLHSCQAARG